MSGGGGWAVADQLTPGLWCRHCGPDYSLRIEYREELEAKPVGAFSLAGQQIKFSAVKSDWPYAVCDNCGRESRGEVFGG